MAGSRQALYIEGLDETLRTFRRLPSDIKKGADEEVREIARFVAEATAGAAVTPAEVKAATSIKSQKASVSLGGGGKRNRPGNMALGTEFGGGARRTTHQFRPHRGRDGYFFWPTIRKSSGEIRQRWDDLVDRLLKEAARGRR